MPTPTPTPIAMDHVLTWDMDDGSPHSILVSPSQARPWLDWALVDSRHSDAANAAGLVTALYTDPNRVAPGDPMYTDDETTFAHDCSGNRITVAGSPNFLMDVHSTHLERLWPGEVRLMKRWGAQYDYVFEDSADEIQTQKLSAQPCGFVQTDWTLHTNAMDGLLGHPMIYNGLGLIPGATSSPGPSIGLNPTTSGGMSEDCYTGRTPSGYFYQPHWYAEENTEIQMARAGKRFICQANWYGDASQSIGLRLFYFASFLMTYDATDDIAATNFSTPSELHVMPEAQLVPEMAIAPMPSDISGLALAGGLYGREFHRCYFAAQFVSACAVLVNPNNPKNSKPAAFPWTGKYQHTLVVSGEGAYDGGVASVQGPPPPSQVPGGTGLILFP